MLCLAVIALVYGMDFVVIAVSIEYKLCLWGYVILVSDLFWVSQNKHSIWSFTSRGLHSLIGVNMGAAQ